MSTVWKSLMLYGFRMDEYQLYTKINVLLLYRSNRNDKHSSVGNHGDPTKVRGECHS